MIMDEHRPLYPDLPCLCTDSVWSSLGYCPSPGDGCHSGPLVDQAYNSCPRNNPERRHWDKIMTNAIADRIANPEWMEDCT